MTLPIQDVLEGKYEILEKIGEGGIGTIYKVRHRLLEEIRVIKVLRQQTESEEGMQERFLHEARMAIQLKHPNIAQLHDFAIAQEGRAYIVMEYIDGVSLDDFFKAAGPPSLDLGLEIACQSLDALGYLHAHEIVHRDVALDNLMLTADFEGNPMIKLIDLGIAKNLGDDSGLTQTGVFVGKVQYCSPEQFSPKGADEPIDRRSDLYSFGVVLYKLLTGHHPFSGETFAEFAGAHLFQAPTGFEESDPEGRLPESLRQTILKALEKDREDRFASAKDFRATLLEHIDPNASLKEEFERSVEATTTNIPQLKSYAKPGSTQARLNQQFGLEATPTPQVLTAIEGQDGSRAEERTEQAPMPTIPKPPATATEKKSLPLAWIGGGAAVAALLLGGLWFAFGRSTEGAKTAAADAAQGPAIEVSQSPRWQPDPAVEDVVDLQNEALAEPPPAEDEVPKVIEEPVQAPIREVVEAPKPVPQPVEVAQPKTETAPAETAPRTTATYHPGPGVTPPALVAIPRPKWPAGAKRTKDDVDVVVTVFVSEAGTVLSATVKQGPAFRRKLKDEALSVANKARFRPAMRNGVAGRMTTDIRVVFKAP